MERCTRLEKMLTTHSDIIPYILVFSHLTHWERSTYAVEGAAFDQITLNVYAFWSAYAIQHNLIWNHSKQKPSIPLNCFVKCLINFYDNWFNQTMYVMHPSKQMQFLATIALHSNRKQIYALNVDHQVGISSLQIENSSIRPMKTEFTAEDYALLSYGTYEEYLDSLIRPQDNRYIRRKAFCRCIAELGYTARDFLTRSQFEEKRNSIYEQLNPVRKVHHLASAGCTPKDVILAELMQRERANRTHLLKTIIFLRKHTRNGKEISGYIDFADSLQRHALGNDDAIDWHDVFAERKLLTVGPSDLCYYDWYSGRTMTNDTVNFKVVTKPGAGMVFVCRLDRRIILINPKIGRSGISTIRIQLVSPKYEQIVLFDHVPRSKYWWIRIHDTWKNAIASMYVWYCFFRLFVLFMHKVVGMSTRYSCVTFLNLGKLDRMRNWVTWSPLAILVQIDQSTVDDYICREWNTRAAVYSRLTCHFCVISGS